MCPKNKVNWTHIHGMVDGCNDPRNSKTEEDVDGVASSDVADGVVRVLLVDRGHLAGKGVGEGGAQSNKGDCSHFVSQTNQATKDAGQISNENNNEPDEEKRNKEARVASQQSRWWDDGEDELEAKGEEMHHIIRRAC